MLMIGTNNTRRQRGAGNRRRRRRRRARDAQGLSRREDPAARDLPARLPGDPVRDKIAEVNRIISRLDDQHHVFYLDIGAKFLDDKGVFLPTRSGRTTCTRRPRVTTSGARPCKDKLAELMKSLC